MTKVRYSKSARVDLRMIRDYTRRVWGLRQVARYIDELDDAVILLARNPTMGRACDDIGQSLMRFERAKHVIFYRIHEDHIFISRILHQQMAPELYRFD